jgi:magnesium transporter
LRILTVFGAIFLPLTFITGVFGMNVLYPGEGTHAGFWVIVGLMVATIAGMIAFFRYKRWL